MRPLRFLLTLLTLVGAFFFLLFAGPWSATIHEDVEERHQTGIGAYFNWRAPSSLFPPSAIISLTDDNSTFFLARPAAFGPLLPSKSLSGQLWVGSGFGDDHLGRGGPTGGSEGELGCSDIPDWSDGRVRVSEGRLRVEDVRAVAAEEVRMGKWKRSLDDVDEDDEAKEYDEDDGTDDHLHHPLPPSDGVKSNGESAGNTKKTAHADIQSLQETAEIAGKVVLLSRGGCGFLEKVKWAQRRGAVALIVGDDIRGGPLVTMYARGDTSNVTIPALFTSHMTAHLLSSLIPSGSNIDEIANEEAAKLAATLGETFEAGRKLEADKPNFTSTRSAIAKATSAAKPVAKEPLQKATYEADEDEEQPGWLRSLFRGESANGRNLRGSPGGGRNGWVLQADFDDDYERRAKSTTSAPASVKTPSRDGGDGFVIGVQDWRDKDLVAAQKEGTQTSTSTSSSTAAQSSAVASHHGPKGGSITPGSGEYVKAAHEVEDLGKQSSKAAATDEHAGNGRKNSGNWLSRLFSSSKDEPSPKQTAKQSMDADEGRSAAAHTADLSQNHRLMEDMPRHHDGLWVTLTPTSMSSSPFFDTLLVLVVSPLVTLTVVYALLLLRSRIRRRRWRAPKSVVERLPVRTYQTMPSSGIPSSTTSAISTPTVSAATPLLPSSGARMIQTRPRSRTASEVPVASGSLSDELAPPSLEQVEEKRAAGLAEWRRRYGGKQRECVVCLEEYVDGVSRVMSLPCGHEFHAECM